MLVVKHIITILYHIKWSRLRYTIKILLEAAVYNTDNFVINESDVENILAWEQTSKQGVEVLFKPARVLMSVLYTKWI